MGKYDSLSRHLESRHDQNWAASFSEIESVLGFALPESARRYPAWWANQSGGGHIQSQSWQDAGWQTANLDLGQKRIEFRRVRSERHYAAGLPKAKVSVSDDDALVEQARLLTGIDDHAALVRAGIKALIEREAGRRLGRLGGTMTDFEAPPRHRENTG